MLSKKKKIFVLITMAVLLVVTGYLNITLNNRVVDTSANITDTNFFATYRTDRLSTRNQEIAYLDAIIASESSSADAKSVAETKRVQLVQAIESELVMEGLIKAKGFNDVIVTSSTNNINVIVRSIDALEASEVSQIVAIIQEQTSKSIDNIKIIPVE
ncbi:MAG: SpoIIIAH-like family protein [Clostridia bacterium]